MAKTKELNLDLPNRNPVNRLDHRPRSQGRPRCRARSPEAKARQAAAQRPGTASKGPRAATKRGSGATDAARVYGTRANAVFSPGQTNVAWLRRLQTPNTWVLPVQDTFLASSMLLQYIYIYKNLSQSSTQTKARQTSWAPKPPSIGFHVGHKGVQWVSFKLHHFTGLCALRSGPKFLAVMAKMQPTVPMGKT